MSTFLLIFIDFNLNDDTIVNKQPILNFTEVIIMEKKEDKKFRVVTIRMTWPEYLRLKEKGIKRKRSLNFLINEAITDMLDR